MPKHAIGVSLRPTKTGVTVTMRFRIPSAELDGFFETQDPDELITLSHENFNLLADDAVDRIQAMAVDPNDDPLY